MSQSDGVVLCRVFFFFKQKTAYDMRISDWSSDVCSSDLNLFDLQGKVAVVTGSSRGIGRAIALRLAQHCAKLVISSRKAEACETVAEEIKANGRSDERRGGKECGRTCRSRWSPYN